MPPIPISDFSRYEQVAKSLAKDAGTIIKDNLQLGIKRTWKSDDTPVTQVDKAINAMVISRLNKEFPEHSILAEEGSDLSRSKEYLWVCDPIDGTFPFMHGIPVSTFTLALVSDGNPILGLIYDPYTDRLFFASTDKPTTLNDQLVYPSQITTLKDATIGVVFWQDNMSIFTPLLSKLVAHGAKIINLCSVAYMDSLVSCGELASVIFPGTSAHDSASAKIIIEQAGGVFGSLTGELDRYNAPVHGHIASCNIQVDQQIRELLA